MIIRRFLGGLFRSFFIASCTNDSSTTSGSSVLLAVGDIVECSSDSSQLTVDIIKVYPTATVATLGDNVYEVGSKEEFECYDKTWGKFKLRTNPSVGQETEFGHLLRSLPFRFFRHSKYVVGMGTVTFG